MYIETSHSYGVGTDDESDELLELDEPEFDDKDEELDSSTGITDYTNYKTYRITIQINSSYINNFISIERLS